MKRSELDFEPLVDEDGTEDVFISERLIEDYLNDIESRVNECKDLLEDIKSVGDLNNVEECLGLLKEISLDLY